MPKVLIIHSNVTTEPPATDKSEDSYILVSSHCPHDNSITTTFYIDETKLPRQLKRAWQDLKEHLADSIELYYMIKYLTEDSDNADKPAD